MGHYTREDLPFYYALADAFTVCDQNYCSVMTSTTPNRSVFWTGTVRDRQDTASRVYMRNDEILSGDMSWKTYPERLHEAAISWKFYQNELTNAGGMNKEEEAWLSNFGCNLLEFFASYNVSAYPGSTLAMQEHIASLTRQTEMLEARLLKQQDAKQIAHTRSSIESNRKKIETLRHSLVNSGEARYRQLTDQERALHDAAFVTNSSDQHYRSLVELPFEENGNNQKMRVPKGDILHQFRKDVSENTLPTISWLSAPEKFSDHPTSPWYGAWYVSEVMNILTKNPEIWKKTIFILTYDENDGYFDHAPSFVAADPKRPMTGGASSGIDTGIEYTYAEDELRQGVSEEQARTGPIGLGFRVPMIVASPWTRGGWVNSQLFEHASTLMFLEHFVGQKFGKKVREENISSWRRAISGDLTSCFRPYDPKNTKLDFLDRNKFVVDIQRSRYKEIPSNFKALGAAEIKEINTNLPKASATAHQESGIRPACSLPYELYADGRLSADGNQFEVHFRSGNAIHGAKSAGAPFNVYLKNTKVDSANKGMIVATYAVKAGDSLNASFPLQLFNDGNYLIEVHGPNGFYRSFAGDRSASNLEIETIYDRHNSEFTGNLILQLTSSSSRKELDVTITDQSYKSASISKRLRMGRTISVPLHLQRNHGWYDFTIETEGFATKFRFAGRVETGRSSFTDPLMGGMI